MVGVAGRSKGCNTCRRRRVRCDQTKPFCTRCQKAGFECLGYERSVQWRHVSSAPFRRSTGADGTSDNASPPGSRSASAPTTPLPQELSLVAFREDMYAAQMLSNFIYRTYGSLWLDLAARGKLGPLSLDATKALSSLAFAQIAPAQELQVQGTTQYGNCLRALAQLLESRTSPVQAKDLLVPILVLIMVASIQGDRTAAIYHLKAAAKVLSLSGPASFQEQPLLNAYESSRSTLLVASLFVRQHSFLEDEPWRTVPWALDPSRKSPQSYLLDIFVTVPGLLEELGRVENPFNAHSVSGSGLLEPISVSNRPFAEPRVALCDRIRQQLENLYAWRRGWQREFGMAVSASDVGWPLGSPAYEAPRSIPDSNNRSRLHFDRPVYANDIMLYNAALMWLVALLWKIDPSGARQHINLCAQRAAAPARQPAWAAFDSETLDFGPLCPPGSSHFLRDAAVEIYRIYEWQSQNHERHAAFQDQTCLYLFPVGMARSVLDAEFDYREWIDDMLGMSPLTAGYGAGNEGVVGFGQYITQASLYPTIAPESDMLRYTPVDENIRSWGADSAEAGNLSWDAQLCPVNSHGYLDYGYGSTEATGPDDKAWR